MKKLNELLDELERGRIDEGLLDAIKKGVARLKKIKVKMIAQNFFKKHPGLLDAVKQYLSGQMKEEQLDEAKFARKLILIGAFLAIAAGIFPMKAAASEPVEYTRTRGEETTVINMNVSPSDGFFNYISNAMDKTGAKGASGVVKTVNDNFRGAFGVLSDGNLVDLEGEAGIKSFLDDAGDNPGEQFVVHSNEVKETGGFTGAGERRVMLQKLIDSLRD